MYDEVSYGNVVKLKLNMFIFYKCFLFFTYIFNVVKLKLNMFIFYKFFQVFTYIFNIKVCRKLS